MRQIILVIAAAVSLLVTTGMPVRAQDPAAEAKGRTNETQEEWSATRHSIKVGGETIPYSANAGTTAIKNDEGELTGLMYSVSYVRSDLSDRSARPVTF